MTESTGKIQTTCAAVRSMGAYCSLKLMKRNKCFCGSTIWSFLKTIPSSSSLAKSLNFRCYFPFGKIDKLSSEGICDDAIKSWLIDKAAIDNGLSNRFSIEVRFL